MGAGYTAGPHWSGGEKVFFTVTFHDPDQAHWLADMPQLAANGHRVDVYDATATLNQACLDALASLPEDNDGYFDGQRIWLGGYAFLVSSIDHGNS